jgi:hypothetical protein
MKAVDKFPGFAEVSLTPIPGSAALKGLVSLPSPGTRR